MSAISFLHKDFSAANARNSGAMKKLMGNVTIKKTLNTESKRGNFYKTLQKYGKASSNMNDAVRKTLGELKKNTSDNITVAATAAIGRELIKNGSRYIMPHSAGNSPNASFKVNIRKGSDVMKATYGKSMPVGTVNFTAGSNAKMGQLHHLSPSTSRSGLQSR
jgi:hypothetical protein